jgi:long-subunit fatty acid transport protein
MYDETVTLPANSKTVAMIFIVCASFAGVVRALQTDIPISPEPVGSGARALGQSAFIAVADDATAASWNPAGLINLEKPEASFVGAWKTSTSDVSSLDQDFRYGEDSWSLGEINFMSYAQPLEGANPDVVISINYHQVYDLGLEFNTTHVIDQGRTVDRIDEARSIGAISAYSLAGGLSIPDNPEITIGASFNWYTQSLSNNHVWQIKTTRYSPRVDRQSSGIETLDDLRGHNFTLGLLWDAYEKQENLLTLGLVCHTPFTAEMEYKLVDTTRLAPIAGNLDMDFPLSVGAGVNYRFCDEFSAALDVQWTDWSEFTYTDNVWPLTDDAVAYRLGGEYLFLEGATESVLACRGGAFYEPRPAWDKIVPVYGLSAGLGLTVKEKFSLDFAYQRRWGEEDLVDFDYRIEEHWFISSVIIYF